jgi:CheY-like chemotaxis protein
MGLFEFLLIASEQENFSLRTRIRRKSQLCRQLGEMLALPPHERDALLVSTLLVDLPEMTRFQGLLADETQDRRRGGRFEPSLALMSGLDCPLPVQDLLSALEDRLTGKSEVSNNVGVEILFTLGAYLSRGENPRSTVRSILGPEAPRHTVEVLDALERVLEAEATADDSAIWARKDKVASRTVILADRDATLLTALELRLTRAGFRAVTVPDGTQALARTRALRPAGVVANLRLPGKDGLSLVMDIRSDPTISETPVILLTNRSSAADVERGLEVGADAVMEKPVNVADLTERLRQIIQVRLGPG